MSLESLYTQAARDTYVGTVRTRQASDAPTNQTLVNFLDGQSKTRSTTQIQDTFQTEFTRNAPNSFVGAGAQGAPRASGQTYSRWTDKAFKLAFDNEGPSQLINGFYTNQFRPEFKGERVHRYTPKLNGTFGDVNASAKTRIVSSPSGAPTGF